MFGRPSAKYRSSDRTCGRYTECIYVVRNVSDVTTNGAILALFDMSCSDVNPNVGLPYIAIVFAFFLWDIAATQNHCRPKDCFDLRCYGQSHGKDGPHTIYPDTYLPSLNVSCDQETLDGGWIMYQRRVDGRLNFTRYWEEYKMVSGTMVAKRRNCGWGMKKFTNCCKVSETKWSPCGLKQRHSMVSVVRLNRIISQ